MKFIVFVFILAKSIFCLELDIKAGPLSPQDGTKDISQYLVYLNGELDYGFDISHYPVLSCTPPLLTTFSAYLYQPSLSSVQKFSVPIKITNTGKAQQALRGASVSNQYPNENIPSSIGIKTQINYILQEYLQSTDYYHIEEGDYVIINVVHNCDPNIDNSNYWNIFNVQLVFNNDQNIYFQYQMLCDPEYYPVQFDSSYLILLMVYGIIAVALARFGKIYSFVWNVQNTQMSQSINDKITTHIFQGLFLNFKYSIIYCLIVLIGLAVELIVISSRDQIIFICIIIISSCLVFMFFNEILCVLHVYIAWIKKPLLFFIRPCDIIAIVPTITLITLYFVFSKAWFLSDLICITILSSLLKLFKVTSLKDALLFYVPCLLTDICVSILLFFYQRYDWDTWVPMYANNPLTCQAPLFNFIYQKKCAWLSIYNLALPGFFLAFIIRFDRNKNSLVYSISCFIYLLCGFIGWSFASAAGGDLPLPINIFTLIPIIGLTTLTALRRGDLPTLWEGNFYDEILLDPFKSLDLSVHQKSKKVIVGDAQNDETNRQTELITTRPSGTYVVNQKLFDGIQVQPQVEEVKQQDEQQNNS